MSKLPDYMYYPEVQELVGDLIINNKGASFRKSSPEDLKKFLYDFTKIGMTACLENGDTFFIELLAEDEEISDLLSMSMNVWGKMLLKFEELYNEKLPEYLRESGCRRYQDMETGEIVWK